MYEVSEDEINVGLYGALILLDSILELIGKEEEDSNWHENELGELAEFIITKGLFEKGRLENEGFERKAESITVDLTNPFEASKEIVKQQSIDASPSLTGFFDNRIELPLFKSEKSRKIAFDLIKQICHINPSSA